MGIPADSFGVPWQGRTLTAQPFAGDDGGADPQLTAALAEWARAAGTVEATGVGDGFGGLQVAAVVAAERQVLAALAGGRLLVAVVAVAGEGHPVPDHVRGDAGADMALAVLVDAEDGRTLPVFTAAASLAAWDQAARPVPVEAQRAALAAVAEGCDELVLDVAGPVRFRVARPAVWALAQGRPWAPPAQDDEVVAAVQRATAEVGADQPALRSTLCLPAPAGGLVVVAAVEPGLAPADLDRLGGALGVALGRRAEVAERVAGLRLVIRPAL